MNYIIDPLETSIRKKLLKFLEDNHNLSLRNDSGRQKIVDHFLVVLREEQKAISEITAKEEINKKPKK